MADKTILIELNVEGQNALIEVGKLQESLKTLEKGTDEYKQALKELTEQEKILLKSQKARDKAQKEASKGMKQLSSDTGASTAATLELGRVFSDMPYGIRGVANNLQQLASNLFFMSKKTDGVTGKMKGFGGAIGSLLKNLIGPAGLLVAFQAIIAAWDYFSNRTKKATKSLSNFRGEASRSATDLKSLLIVLKENMLSKEDLTHVIGKVNKKYKDLNLNIGEEGRLTKESRIQIEKKIHSMGQLALANAMLSEIEKKNVEVAKAAVKLQEGISEDLKALGVVDLKAFRDIQKQREGETKRDFIKRKNALIQHQKGSYKGLVDMARLNRERNVREEIKAFDETKIRVSQQVKELLKITTDEGFFDEFFNSKETKGAGKIKKISPFKSGKELELDIKSNEAALLSFGKKTELQLLKNKQVEELNSAKTEEQRNIIKKRYAKLALIAQIENERKELLLKKATEKAILQGKYDTFQVEAELRRLAYIDTINKTKLTEEQKLSAIKKANADTLKLTSAAFKEQQAELGSDGTFETQWRATLAAFETLTEARLKLADVSKIEKSTFETDLEKMAAYAEAAKAILGGITEFVNGEFDRQLIIEQNKTNALNNELNERLLNENLSKDGREAIQNQIAQNDERLRVKQEKIERKRFKMQKAANIALAMVDTFRAGVGVLADTRGGTVARIAGMTAVIASGLLTVASIARQKFQSSAGSSPLAGGNAGGGSARAEPSFNIVGRSNDNLLLNAIQSQFDQPLRAYVVARDVTSQQQMDGVISGEAST